MVGLRQCRGIVTDTYHVAVNAWSVGVPAVLVIDDGPFDRRNVNFGHPLAPRDKRWVFMSMYDALDFLVPARELADKGMRQARLLHLLDLFGSQREIHEISGRMRRHAHAAEDALMVALKDLL
jgi:hypothetical protein